VSFAPASEPTSSGGLRGDSSDGKTTEEKVRQILAVVPILPGQTAKSAKSNARKISSIRVAQHPPTTQSRGQQQRRQADQLTEMEDLIDLGDDSTSLTTSVFLAPHVQTPRARSTSELQPPQSSVRPGSPVRRSDSLTNDSDLLVDVE
jgi:hypothetical protein